MGVETYTSINPLALLFTGIMCILVLFAKRETIIIPLILTACFITDWQRILIFGVDFTMLRILIILGLFRIYMRGEFADITLNSIDKTMLIYITCRTIIYTIQFSNFSAFVYMCGQAVDFVGAYFFIRGVIHNLEDYDTILKTIILMSIPVALFMLIEQISGGHNIFSMFGGVPELSEIRGGRLRAQGAFAHSIMAGTFGATVMGFALGIKHRNYRLLSAVGIFNSLIIVWASSSSGPIMTLIFVFSGIFFWSFRNYTKIIRNLFFLSLVIIHLIMNNPIWIFLARIDLVGGSTGEHRYRLFDAAVRNFWGWAFFGIPDTRVWGFGLQDITNQYIAEGAWGGVLSMILFIIIIVKCFKTIGNTRKRFDGNPKDQKYIWSLGVILFAYSITFISITFFGQMVFFYYTLLAMISSLNNLAEQNIYIKLNNNQFLEETLSH